MEMNQAYYNKTENRFRYFHISISEIDTTADATLTLKKSIITFARLTLPIFFRKIEAKVSSGQNEAAVLRSIAQKHTTEQC